MAGEVRGRLRVVTWNVWWRFGPAWRDRQPVLLQRLREVDADVIALQECWGAGATSQAHEFAEDLGMFAGFVEPSLPPRPKPGSKDQAGVTMGREQAGVAVGIGLLSRWPLEHVHAVALPARHRNPAPVALIAQVRHPVGPLHVVAACLEWEPAYNDDRIAQAGALAGLATDPSTDGALPVICCGDLNAAPDSPVLRPLRDTLIDAWVAGGGDVAARTLPSDHPHAPLEATEVINQRVDHIFFRPGRPGVRVDVDSVALLGAPVAGLHPSDHMGVMCELTWPVPTAGDA